MLQLKAFPGLSHFVTSSKTLFLKEHILFQTWVVLDKPRDSVCLKANTAETRLAPDKPAHSADSRMVSDSTWL